MSKGTRLIKRVAALFLVLLFSIESFAAIVSDNDGSAFITKAEFDSLKNDFQTQIDNYNTSIDSKIDGAIAAYLAGIRVSLREGIKNVNKVDPSDKEAFKFIKFLEKDELEASHIETYYDVSFMAIKFCGSSKWGTNNIITYPNNYTANHSNLVVFAKTGALSDFKNNWGTYYDASVPRLWLSNAFLLSKIEISAKDKNCVPFYNDVSQSVTTKVPYITKQGYVESWGQKALQGNFTGLYECSRWGNKDYQRFHLYLDEQIKLNQLVNKLNAEWNGIIYNPSWSFISDKIMTNKSRLREQELSAKGVGSWKNNVSPAGTIAGSYQAARFGGVSYAIVDVEKPKDKGLYIVSSVDDDKDKMLNYIKEDADIKADKYEYKNSGDREWYDNNKWCYLNKQGNNERTSADGTYTMSAELTLPLVCSYDSSITKWTDLKDKHLILEENEGRLYEGIPILKAPKEGKVEFSLNITNDSADNTNTEYYVYIKKGVFSKNQSDFSGCIKVKPEKIKKDVTTKVIFEVEQGKQYFMFIKGVEDEEHNGLINYFSDFVFEG